MLNHYKSPPEIMMVPFKYMAASALAIVPNEQKKCLSGRFFMCKYYYPNCKDE